MRALGVGEKPYIFEHAAMYEEITRDADYVYYLKTLKNAPVEDLPPAERKPIKILGPLHTRCPYTPEELEAFRTATQPSQAWLDARAYFLTSSRFGEMAAESPLLWGTPIDYFRQVTGRIVPPPFTALQESYTKHGQAGEPIAKAIYARLTKCAVVEEGLRVLDEAPWIYGASSDGLRNGQPETDGIIEIKCNAVGDPKDYAPKHYIPQVMGAMAAYSAPFADFITYWMREGIEKRATFATRVHFNAEYWRLLKMRLDYMAWAIVNDRAPTGFRHIKCYYPLPACKTEDFIFDVGTASDHDRLVARPETVLPLTESAC